MSRHAVHRGYLDIQMLHPGLLRKFAAYLAVGSVVLLVTYWLKNHAGINLFQEFSLSERLPFKLLKLESTIRQDLNSAGLAEDFESILPLPNRWIAVHTRIPENVSKVYGRNCPGASRCLTVKNKGNERWHITHRYRFDVRENERFSLAGLLWSSDTGGEAQVQVTAYDAQGQIIARDMWHIETRFDDEFEQVSEEFSIAPAVATIRLRRAGKGPGEFRFDDIRLRRLDFAGISRD